MVAPLVAFDRSDVEGLVRLDFGVAVDRDRDRLRVLVGSEMQRADGRDIVAVGDSGGAVGGGEVHVECRRAAAACDREGRHLRAAVALADRDVVDRDRARNRCAIIVGDGADTLRVADGGAVGRI